MRFGFSRPFVVSGCIKALRSLAPLTPLWWGGEWDGQLCGPGAAGGLPLRAGLGRWGCVIRRGGESSPATRRLDLGGWAPRIAQGLAHTHRDLRATPRQGRVNSEATGLGHRLRRPQYPFFSAFRWAGLRAYVYRSWAPAMAPGWPQTPSTPSCCMAEAQTLLGPQFPPLRHGDCNDPDPACPPPPPRGK